MTAELIADAVAGDVLAFETLVSVHRSRALVVANRIVCDMDVAQDVVQDAFVRIWKRLGEFNPERANFGTWLHRIVVNAALDHRKKHPLLIGIDDLPDETLAIVDSPDACLDHAQAESSVDDNIAQLPACLAQLSDEHQLVLKLCDTDGLSHAAAARSIGIAPGTVTARLTRARSEMRRLLRPGVVMRDKHGKAVEAKPRGPGRRRILDADGDALIGEILAVDPTLTLEGLHALLAGAGICLGLTAIHRALVRLKLTVASRRLAA